MLVRDNGGAWQLFYINSDYLGSVTHIVNGAGTIVGEYSYDACVFRTDGREGSMCNPVTHAIYANGQQPELFLGRGYTGHSLFRWVYIGKHLAWFGLINMNARLYDPVHGRFLAPDPYVQAPDFTQSFNRYGYAFSNPLSFTDATGEIAWFVPIIIGAAIGAYMGGSIANSDFNPVRWDWSSGRTWAGIGGGLLTGAISGAGWSFGLAALNGSTLVGGKTIISGMALNGVTKFAGAAVLLGKGVNTLTTAASMISNFENASRIIAGRYYLNDGVSFGEQLLQGFSRFTWEGLQTWAGYNYTQIRNTVGNVDRVDYLDGATFATRENARFRQGISLGNFLNIAIWDEITEPFQNRVLRDPLFMHEYGHIKDSRILGFGYLFGIGIPSAVGSEWTELRANRHAATYFGKHYGVDWTPFVDRGYPLHR